MNGHNSALSGCLVLNGVIRSLQKCLRLGEFSNVLARFGGDF